MDRSICHRTTIGSSSFRNLLFALGVGVATVIDVGPVRALEMCGGTTYPFPYTDVASVGAAFCPGIMEAYVTGISKGTTPTTFSPNEDVPRLQMTTFLQRTSDQVLSRGSRRAALNQWWIPRVDGALQTIKFGGGSPFSCAADGENIWVPGNDVNGSVFQVQASTGTILGTWTGANGGQDVLAVAGLVFVIGNTGTLYVVDPAAPGSLVALFTSGLGTLANGIAFDGSSLWMSNASGSVSIMELTSTFAIITVSTGFTEPDGILYDGTSIWITDFGAGKLFKLGFLGSILQTVTVGSKPGHPVFDGANIWVPNEGDNSITVVQASTGNVVATITGDSSNGLSTPIRASFDGERILVTNYVGDSITLFKAADLSLIANVSTGASSGPVGACSDGINFWATLRGTGALLRF